MRDKKVFPDSVEPSYLPSSRIFENLLNSTDYQKLRQLESDFTFVRSFELLQNPSLIPKTFDFQHLKQIHGYIFQDIYSWAGKPRSFDMAKNGDVFTPANELPIYEEEVFSRSLSLIRDFKSGSILKIDVPSRLARCLGIINIYHPFPEGNGRAQRIFISILAKEIGFNVDWRLVTKWEMVEIFKLVHLGDYSALDDLMLRITNETKQD